MSSHELKTCPSCELMAHHFAEWRVPVDRVDVEIFVWNSKEPIRSPPYWQMECIFCHHQWRDHGPDLR